MNAPQMNLQVIQQLKGIMNQVRMAQNPQLMLNQLLMTNPQIQQAFDLIKQSGGDPKTTFYNYAKQLGVDPQMVLNSLQS